MKTSDARRVLEAARAEAARIGKPVSVAIVDASTTLVLFERLDDASAFTAFVAEGKAAASAFTLRDSSNLKSMSENYPGLIMSAATKLHGRFVPAPGGVLLRDHDGAVAGAIGVSGATAEEDEQIARAGAAAL